MRKWITSLLIFGVPVLVIGGTALFLWLAYQHAPQTKPANPRELLYIVPLGTNAKLGLGEIKSVLPSEVELTVGVQDILVIQNQDNVPIEVANILIHPGQQYIQQFRHAGTFDLICSVHTGSKIKVVVNPPPQ